MHTQILRRCGLLLAAVGILDIAYMVWCIANQVSYRSSFNVFALVGGILLVRGGLKTARWVAALSTFMLAASGIGMLVMPLIHPIGYWLAVVKHGSGLVGGLFVAAALLGLLAWVRQQVLHPDVLEAQRAAGLPPPRVKLPLIVGIALPVLLVVPLELMFRGETAREALRRAEQQLGERYRYVVTSLQMNSNLQGKNVYAIVTAYNDSEMKSIEIQWKE